MFVYDIACVVECRDLNTSRAVREMATGFRNDLRSLNDQRPIMFLLEL